MFYQASADVKAVIAAGAKKPVLASVSILPVEGFALGRVGGTPQ